MPSSGNVSQIRYWTTISPFLDAVDVYRDVSSRLTFVVTIDSLK